LPCGTGYFVSQVLAGPSTYLTYVSIFFIKKNFRSLAYKQHFSTCSFLYEQSSFLNEPISFSNELPNFALMIVRKSLILPTIEYYMTHLSIINAIIPSKLRITPREIDVLASFLSIPTSERFTSYGRKQVKDTLNLSPSSLSNHMKALITKKFILTSPDDENIPIDIAPTIIPTPTQEYHIRITHDPALPNPEITPSHEDINHNLINYNGTTSQNKGEKEEEYQTNY